MRECKPYLVECQVIRQVKTINIPKHGKSRSKIRQNGRQNTTFYNAICVFLEIEQKQAKQQPRRKNDETQEKRKPKRSGYKAFQAA